MYSCSLKLVVNYFYYMLNMAQSIKQMLDNNYNLKAKVQNILRYQMHLNSAADITRCPKQ